PGPTARTTATATTRVTATESQGALDRRDPPGLGEQDRPVPGQQYVRLRGEHHPAVPDDRPHADLLERVDGRVREPAPRPDGDVEHLEAVVPQHRHLVRALTEGEAGHLL